MRLQDLPAQLLAHIGAILDPRSRLAYLMALENLLETKEADKGPRYWCFYCFQESWYESIVQEKAFVHKEHPFVDEFAVMRQRIRRKLVTKETVNANDGSQLQFLRKRYERRDYSNEDRELNQAFLYLGTVISID